jgi:DNA invertase Pin-like site-specific DNA recombinase
MPKQEIPGEATAIMADDSTTKTDRIKRLIEMGISMTAIANGMGLSFQRVKNVKKLMEKEKAATKQ